MISTHAAGDLFNLKFYVRAGALPDTLELTINRVIMNGGEYSAESDNATIIIASSVYVQETIEQPKDFQLLQNYPNPFNPSTTIAYQLPEPGHVELVIYNMEGQKVVTLVSERQPAGSYTYEWHAGALASGVYFYRITSGKFVGVKKLLLMK